MKETQDSDVPMKSVDGDGIPSGDSTLESNTPKGGKKGKTVTDKKGKGKAVESKSTPTIRPMTRSHQPKTPMPFSAVAKGSTSTPKRKTK
jgi:hypothetical protein